MLFLLFLVIIYELRVSNKHLYQYNYVAVRSLYANVTPSNNIGLGKLEQLII